MIKEWFLIHYHVNKHLKVRQEMQNIGVEFYMPMYTHVTIRADRKHSFRTHARPLFPGYLFIRFSPEEIHTTVITKQQSVGGFVHFGHYICKIHPDFIEEIQHVINDTGMRERRHLEELERAIKHNNESTRNKLLLGIIEQTQHIDATLMAQYQCHVT